MPSDRPTTPGLRDAAPPERLSLLGELRALDAGLRETRVDWRGELRVGLRCAFGLRRTRPRDDRPSAAADAPPVTAAPVRSAAHAAPRTAAR